MKLSEGVTYLVTICAFFYSNTGQVLSKDRLKEYRQEFLYPFNSEDYQSEITSNVNQVHKDLSFHLPFYGFRYNYTRVSLNGYLDFTDPPQHYSYPLKFPRNYPDEKDPAFIGPFFSKTRIGSAKEDVTKYQYKNGVYFRVESNLNQRSDKNAIEIKERIKADLQEDGLVGSKKFEPKHVIITTWKGVSFFGGVDSSKFITNTFQAVVATDEIETYAIFNYAEVNWTSHTEAGGDSVTGEGGYPAFIGFNAGRGIRAFEYHPYSQRFSIKDLTKNGCVKGRHIFKIDGKIAPGFCSDDMDYMCQLYLDQN